MGGAALPLHSQLVVALGLLPLYFIPTEEKGRCMFLKVRSANLPFQLIVKPFTVVPGKGILAFDAGGVSPQSKLYVWRGKERTLNWFGAIETATVKSGGAVYATDVPFTLSLSMFS